MNEIMDQLQPYITSIVVALVGLLTTVILAVISKLKVRVNEWIDTKIEESKIKISESQREQLHKIANEAFAHAESMFKTESGIVKLSKAFIYASEKLGLNGIKVTDDEITAAIEKACLEYNANKVKVVKGDKAS